MNKRQRSILTGRRPPRRVSSATPTEKVFGPSPLRLVYREMMVDVILIQAQEVYRAYLDELTQHIFRAFGIPAHPVRDK